MTSPLSAKKLNAFVDKIMTEENATKPYSHWNDIDVRAALFAAIVKWDSMLRSDFTTGIDEKEKP